MPRRKPVDTDAVAEAVAAYSARRSPRGTRGKPSGKKADLTPKEARYVEAVVLGAPSQVAAATIAGYADPVADAYAVARRPRVQAAIEDRRTEAQQRAGIDIAGVWRQMHSYMMDDGRDVRSSAVRAGELLLKGAGELDTRINVTVDQRSALLPAVDPGQAGAALERMFVDAAFTDSVGDAGDATSDA